MKRLIALAGAAVLGLAALSSVAAQQPNHDSIEVSTRDSGCTIRIIWTDGTDDSTHLRVSVNAIERGTVLIDDFVGDQDGNANPLASFGVDSGSNTINARLYTGPVDEPKLLDEDRETHECVPPTPTSTPLPTATVTPFPTATPPPTATSVPPTASAPDLLCLNGRLDKLSETTYVCTAISPVPTAPVAPPPLQTAICPNGSVITVGVGVCPSPQPATVQLPAGVRILPPNTGSAGLQDVLLDPRIQFDTGCDGGQCGGFRRCAYYVRGGRIAFWYWC